jgi:hypothetical protein
MSENGLSCFSELEEEKGLSLHDKPIYNRTTVVSIKLAIFLVPQFPAAMVIA